MGAGERKRHDRTGQRRRPDATWRLQDAKARFSEVANVVSELRSYT